MKLLCSLVWHMLTTLCKQKIPSGPRWHTPEQSEHTSIQLRIKAALKGEQPASLLPFIGNERQLSSKIVDPKGIAFSLQDYLEVVDDTGRIIRDDKRGAISALNASSAKLLTQLDFPQDNWLKLTTEFCKLFHGPVGTLQELSLYCEHLKNADDT
jgi:hypothetical protein